MKEEDYLAQVASLTGLQHYLRQGPWGRKSGSVIGTRDGYITVIGFNRSDRSAKIVILLRFKKLERPELVKAALAENHALSSKKKGKLAEVGNSFLRWEWKYSFSKPNAEEVARLADTLREAIKQTAPGFDGRCEECSTSSTPSLILMNSLPSFVCAGCQEKIRQSLDEEAIKYEQIQPNYPNGLVLGIAAALAGAVVWGLVAYAINRIFLYGAILIGYLVAAAVIRGSGKVTRFGQIIVPVLTIASIFFGDAIFYTLSVMKSENMPFSWRLLQAMTVHLAEIEMKGSGILSLIFALVGAGYALYAARKPRFKAVFEPLASPGSVPSFSPGA